MKTKFKSLFTVALAAATFASCSNEIDAPENGAMLNPGDAQITIGLGDGVTTYSTEVLEEKVHDGSGVLISDGKKITLTNATIKEVSGKIQFSAIIKAGDFTEGASAKLYLYTNGTPSSDIEARIDTAIVKTVLNRDLTNGLPAGFGPTAVKLTAGTITGKAELVRAAARIGARAGAGSALSDIENYTVELTNPNMTSGGLFGTVTPAFTGVKQSYTLKGDATGMYKSTETVAYVYPSTTVVNGIVTAPDKVTTKPFTFTPARGKNYTVVITPKTTSDGKLDFAVSVKGWDAESDTDVDFGGGETKVSVKEGDTGVVGFKGTKDGKLEINAGTAAASLVTPAGLSISAEQLLGKEISDNEASFNVTATRAGEKVISTDGNLALSATAKIITISALPNHSTDVNYTIEITGATTNTKYLVNVLVKGSGFHPRFVSSFNGFQVMQMAMVRDTKGNDVTSEVFNDFENTYNAPIVAHSFFNGATAKSEYFNKAGTKLSTDVCPKGFRMLKNKEELAKFLGMATWTVIAEKAPTGTNTPIMAGAVGIRSGSVGGVYHSALLKSAAGEELAIVGDETIRTADGFFFQFLSSNKYSTGINTTSKNLRCVKDSFK